MIPLSKFYRYLKIHFCVISLLISNYSFCQNISDSNQIIKIGGRYEYNDTIYKKKELKNVIYNSHDSAAIRLFERAKTSQTVGQISGIGGLTLFVAGCILGFNFFQYYSGDILVSIGFCSMIFIAFPSAIISSASYKKSIERFNSIQVGNQNVGFKIVPAPDYIGISLTWHLYY